MAKAKRVFRIRTQDPWSDKTKGWIRRETERLVKEFLERGGKIQRIPMGKRALETENA